MNLTIKIRLGNAELEYSEPIEKTTYPIIVTRDTYENGVTKSERLLEVISKLVDEVKKLHKEEQ